MARRHSFENDGYDEFTAYLCVTVHHRLKDVFFSEIYICRGVRTQTKLWYDGGWVIIRWFILLLESLFIDVIMSYDMVFQFCD